MASSSDGRSWLVMPIAIVFSMMVVVMVMTRELRVVMEMMLVAHILPEFHCCCIFILFISHLSTKKLYRGFSIKYLSSFYLTNKVVCVLSRCI